MPLASAARDAMSDTPEHPADTEAAPASDSAPAATVRKRPKPGERRVQILQTLATMLEQPGAERGSGRRRRQSFGRVGRNRDVLL